MAAPKIVERRTGEGRRRNDGQAGAVQVMSDHALARQIVGVINRVLIGLLTLGGLWIIKETITPFAAHTTTNVNASLTMTISATATM